MTRWIGVLLSGLALGACVCPPGTAECNGECIDVEYDEQNCGGCRTVCAAGTVCVEGECAGAPATGFPCSEDAVCDDGYYCNGVELCLGGRCTVSVDPPDCDDGADCTRDYCDPDLAACVSVPDHDPCPEGTTCTGSGASGCE